jgi:hypothetical protein
MPRHLIRTIALTVLVVVAVAAAGCGSTEDAAAALDAASKQTKIFEKADAAISKVIEQLDALENDKSGYKRAVVLITEAEKQMPVRAAAIAAAKVQWDKIASMDVDADLKKWAAMRSDLCDLQLQGEKKLAATLTAMKDLFSYMAKGTVDAAVVKKKAAQLQTLSEASDQAQKAIEAKSAEAGKFFIDKGIGK